MLKLLAVSSLLRRVKESPETRRRRLNPNSERESATETETDAESGTETEVSGSEGSGAGESGVSESRLEAAAESESESRPAAESESESRPAAESESESRPAAESEPVQRRVQRPRTARPRRPRPEASSVSQQPPPAGQQWGGWPQLSASRLLGLAAAAALLAALTVRSADQLRQSRLLQVPRLTYGQWLARREHAAAEPAVLVGRRRLRFNTTAPVHVRWPDHDTCRHHVVR